MNAMIRLAALALVATAALPLVATAGPRSKDPADTNCPWWRPCGPGETLGGNKRIPQGAFGVDARPVCQRHDDCYDTPGMRRKDCDKKFRDELKCLCESSTNPRACKRRANLAYIAVRVLGGSQN